MGRQGIGARQDDAVDGVRNGAGRTPAPEQLLQEQRIAARSRDAGLGEVLVVLHVGMRQDPRFRRTQGAEIDRHDRHAAGGGTPRGVDRIALDAGRQHQDHRAFGYQTGQHGEVGMHLPVRPVDVLERQDQRPQGRDLPDQLGDDGAAAKVPRRMVQGVVDGAQFRRNRLVEQRSQMDAVLVGQKLPGERDGAANGEPAFSSSSATSLLTTALIASWPQPTPKSSTVPVTLENPSFSAMRWNSSTSLDLPIPASPRM